MNFERNDCGSSERADCTVRALALTLGIDYGFAHQRLRAMGRKNGCRFKVDWGQLGFQMRPDLCCRTLGSVLPEMQSGRFIVRITRHVFAVIDGKVIDQRMPSERCRMKMVYQFIP